MFLDLVVRAEKKFKHKQLLNVMCQFYEILIYVSILWSKLILTYKLKLFITVSIFYYLF